jgi:hypothetical protein
MTRIHAFRAGALAVLALLGRAGGAHAQTLGEITGVVRDVSAGVVAGAKVTAVNTATNAGRSTTTNTAGVYSIPALPPGTYVVKAEQAGLKTATRSDVEVHVQQTVRVDFQMEVGNLQEAVEVTGSSVRNTEDVTLGTVIDNKRIVDLPLNGRNFLQLVATAPNVSFGFQTAGQAGARQGGTRSEQSISVAGQRSNFNRFTIDGIENTDVNFNTYIILPSVDALQEFKVQHGIFPAEFGRAATQINVSTKSGGNQFHGAGFGFLRDDKFDARRYAFTSSAPRKQPFNQKQFGATLSGPVWVPGMYKGTDRLFFMANYEGLRERRTVEGLYTVPTAAMRNGDFSAFSNPIYDPATRVRGPDGRITAQPFPGNIIPASRIHPTSRQLLEFYPAPNLGTGLGTNFQNEQDRRTDKDQITGRLDFVESSRSNWAARFSWGDETQIAPALYLNGTKLLTTVKQLMLSNTRVVSSSKVNELRFGFNKFFNSIGTELAFTRDVVGELKLPGVDSPPEVGWGIPSISVAGFSGFGDSTEGPYVNNNKTFQLVDNFSCTLSRHSLRFGGEMRIDQFNQVGNQFARGSFAFEGQATQNAASPAGTGNAFADYLLGECRRCEKAVALATAKFRANSYALYVDDTWKVSPKVTLNLGLRYELTPPWLDENGTLINAFVPAFDNTPNVQDPSRHPTLVRVGSGDFYEGTLLRFNPAIQVARDGRLGERLVATDYNDFAPRLGVAWSPNAKWTVRTGAGIFYSQDTGNPRFDMARNLSGRRRDESNADFPDLNWDHLFRNLSGTVQINNPYVLANIHDRRTPYSFQYLLNVQRELGRTVVELGYLGSQSRNLESLRAINESLPGATGTVLSRAPYPEFGRIQEVSGHGEGSYNGLSVKVQQRPTHGLSYLLGYTWSKSIDNASAIRNQNFDTLFPQNSYDTDAERALSSFNVSHRFVGSFLWDLPFGEGRRFLAKGGALGRILGGWELSGILTAESGFPITIMTGRDQSNTGAGFDRPNATGQSWELPASERNPDHWFNTGAFALQPFGTFGDVGRNSIIGAGLFVFDLSLIKNVRIAREHTLQLRLESFNVTNHPNWGPPNNTLVSSAFGRITGTRTNMREVQFGVKYIF